MTRETNDVDDVRSADNVVRYETNRDLASVPYFSICIPQYNRSAFLIRSLESFRSQIFQDFEVCISDGASTDGEQSAVIDYLKKSGLTFVYSQSRNTLRYDPNLRSAIQLSNGKYIFLMGNDDELAAADVLLEVHKALERFEPVAAVVTNYRELGSGVQYRRTGHTKVLGHGVDIAARTFRNYSFLSGIVFEGESARQATTDVLDGSEMYQMYLGTRLVSCGGRYLDLDRTTVNKDIQIPGQIVDSYQTNPRVDPCPIVERHLPMGRLLEVVATGLNPHQARKARKRALVGVASQLYQFTYPFWLIEYRRTQSWRYAAGVFIGLRPSVTAKRLDLPASAKIKLWTLYILGGCCGLVVPISAFQSWRQSLHRFAKRRYRT